VVPLRIVGLSLEGEVVRKTVLLPLGEADERRQRIARSGLTLVDGPTGPEVMALRLKSQAAEGRARTRLQSHRDRGRRRPASQTAAISAGPAAGGRLRLGRPAPRRIRRATRRPRRSLTYRAFGRDAGPVRRRATPAQPPVPASVREALISAVGNGHRQRGDIGRRQLAVTRTKCQPGRSPLAPAQVCAAVSWNLPYQSLKS
jgi:hypothetical protein